MSGERVWVGVREETGTVLGVWEEQGDAETWLSETHYDREQVRVQVCTVRGSAIHH